MQNEQSIILFDGICNLCNTTVDFLLKHDRHKQFKFVALQSDEGKDLSRYHQISLDIDSVILIKQNKAFIESDAIIEIARLLNYPWKLGSAGKILPKALRDSTYRFVAKNRYHWFGKRKTCRIIPATES